MLPTNGKITQDFYKPVDYIPGRTRHEALDIVTNGNQIIYALGNGVVTKVIDGKGYLPNKGYGNEIWIQYDNGVLSRAAHCAIGIIAKVGQRVVEGQRVAYTGATGYRQPLTVIHVHYETMINGVRVDPMTVDYGNNQSKKKRMKITNTQRAVWVKEKKDPTATIFVIKKHDKHPLETLHEVKSQKATVLDLFGQNDALKRVEWKEIKGLTKGDDYDVNNEAITHPEYFELQ